MSTPNSASSSNKALNGTTVHARPTILLITGSWHVPEHYSPLIDSLTALGHQVSCPLLPSNSGQSPPPDLDDDIFCVRRHAARLLATGQDLFVLMHSYGGIVGSYAFADLSPTVMEGNSTPGKAHGRLKAIMYMTSFIPLAGESLNDILALHFGVRRQPPFIRVDEQRKVNVLSPEAAAAVFYQDCSVEEQQRAGRLLVDQGSDAQEYPPRSEELLRGLGVGEAGGPEGLRLAYLRKGVEVAYLYCDLDAGLTLPLQEMMVGRVKKTGIRVREWHVKAGHSPFSGKAGETAAVVHEMIGLLQ